jgi:hypothetical protein
MFRQVQSVQTAGKSHDLLRFDDAEIDQTDKPQAVPPRVPLPAFRQ